MDFPAPFGSDDAGHAAIGDAEADAVEHVAAAVSGDDVLEAEDRLPRLVAAGSASPSVTGLVDGWDIARLFVALTRVAGVPEIRVEDPRVVAHRRGGAAHDRRALVHDGDLGAQAHDELHVVLDDEERLVEVAVQRLDAVPDLVDERRVDAACRLVEEENLGVGDEQVGELEQLALAVGEVSGWPVREAATGRRTRAGPSPALSPRATRRASQCRAANPRGAGWRRACSRAP